MSLLPGRGVLPQSRERGSSLFCRGHAEPNAGRDDAGFTLVELLIVIVVVPLIIGAIALGLFSVFALQTHTGNRLADTSDAQVVAASFQPDVQSALAITTQNTTTSPGSTQCGTGYQILGMEWNPNPSGGYNTTVSYVEVANGSTNNSVNLVRQFCLNGNTTSPVNTSVLSYDLPSVGTPVSLVCATTDATCSTQAATQWVSTSGVIEVNFNTVEPKSNYNFALQSFPEASAQASDAGAPITPSSSTTCGFASPGSGTYASTLCFVDFSNLTGSALTAATASGGCLEMSVTLPSNNLLYFCIHIAGTSILPFALPTWTNGFLGNQGTTDGQGHVQIPANYTNVPGKPAIYQQGSGTTTITLTNITVDNSQGVPATGWEFMTADAESTDSNESITWTSDQKMYDVPNGTTYDTSSDPIGNACLDDQLNQGLTGLKTTTVSCVANLPSENGHPAETETGNYKSGTAMLEAPAPTTMTVTLVGGGLEGVVFGVFLS